MRLRTAALLLLACICPAGAAPLPAALSLGSFESAEETRGWRGVTFSTEQAREGKGSALWADLNATFSAAPPAIPADWTAYAFLQFSLYSARANGQGLQLVLFSENPATEGIDYYSQAVRIDFTGWRDFSIPLADLLRTASRKPLGLDQVTSVSLTANGWNHTPMPESRLFIDRVRLVRNPVRASVVRATPSRAGVYTVGVEVENLCDEGLPVSFSVGEKVQPGPTLAPGEKRAVELAVAAETPSRRTPRLPGIVVGTRDIPRAAALSVNLAEQLYRELKPAPHPRLFFTDVAALRAKMGDPWGRKLGEGVIRDAEAWLTRELIAPPLLPDKSKRLERSQAGDVLGMARRQIGGMQSLALAYLLTGDRRFADRAKEVAFQTLTWDTWVDPFHFPLEVDLAAGETAFGLGVTYDWIYDTLTPAERDRLRAGVVERVMKPFYRMSRANVWWATCKHNWRGVVVGGCGVAALAFLGEEPDAPHWAAEASARLSEYPGFFGADGGWGEGVGYWVYGTTYFAYWADAARRVTGGRDDLFADSPGFRESPLFALYATVGDTAANFADAGTGVPRTPLFHLFASAYRNGAAQWFAREYGAGGTWAYVWYDPKVAPAAPEGTLPLGRSFADVEWAVSRTDFSRARPGTALIATAGTNGQNHGHLDAGGFILWAYGDILLRDLGAAAYSGDYFSSKRWGFYQAGSVGHNVLLIDGKNQAPGTIGKVVDFATGAAGDAYTLVLDQPYRDTARRVLRRVAFVRPDMAVLYDEAALPKPAPAEVLLHPSRQATLDADGAFTVTTARAALRGEVYTPEGAAPIASQHEKGEPLLRFAAPPREKHAFLTVLRTARAGGAEAGPLAPFARALVVVDKMEPDVERALALLERSGIRAEVLAAGDLPRFPSRPEELRKRADLLILTTVTGGASAYTPAQLGAIAGCVQSGGSLLVVGGPGQLGNGGFGKTPLAAVLPVEVGEGADLVTNVRYRPEVQAAGHPVLRGIPAPWPQFGSPHGGYHRVRARAGAQVPMVAPEGAPFLALSEVGQGRVAFFNPLWSHGTGGDFQKWEHAPRFLSQLCAWLARKPLPALVLAVAWPGTVAPGAEGALAVTVENRGETALRDISVSVETGMAGAKPAAVPELAPGASRQVALAGRWAAAVGDTMALRVCARSGRETAETSGTVAAALPVGTRRIWTDTARGVEITRGGARTLVLFAVEGKPIRYEGLESDAGVLIVPPGGKGIVRSGGTRARR